MNKVWTKELLFDILIMFNTIWQENDMSNKYNEKQRDRTAAPLFLTSLMQSPTPQNTRFCVNPMRFSLFLSGEEGGGRRFFVNEGEHAGGREAACGLAAGVVFGLQYAEWQRITWWLRAGMDVDGGWGIVTCYMLHVTLSVRAIHGRG